MPPPMDSRNINAMVSHIDIQRLNLILDHLFMQRKGSPSSCINYFRELTERLRSQGSNELFLCILNATTDGFQKHQCNGVSYRYPKAQLDLRPSFYATLGSRRRERPPIFEAGRSSSRRSSITPQC